MLFSNRVPLTVAGKLRFANVFEIVKSNVIVCLVAVGDHPAS